MRWASRDFGDWVVTGAILCSFVSLVLSIVAAVLWPPLALVGSLPFLVSTCVLIVTYTISERRRAALERHATRMSKRLGWEQARTEEYDDRSL